MKKIKMRKLIPFILGAAVAAPLFLATPAQAQSYDHIQELEERVQEARQRGDWGYAQQLNVQLNMARLQYQKAHGLPEYSNSGQIVRPNSNYYYPHNRGRYYQQQHQRGYYDRWGNWRSY